MTSAIYVLGDVSIHPDILICEFWAVFEHPPLLLGCTSAACPLQSGRRAITSITIAAVSCDADEPCSVNTAWDHESSFTISTRPLYFWCFVSNSSFFKWQMPISETKWTFASNVLASSIVSFLLLTFVRFHAEIFSIFPFFIHCCFLLRVSSLLEA